jgi:CRP/FNR family cyclic AMP-dependent transcriptional regulator
MIENSPIDAKFIAEVPFFKHLSESDRVDLSQSLERLHVPAGRLLFAAGDPGDCLYIIKSGSVELFVRNTVGDKVLLHTSGEGDLFGELSLLDSGPRSASALAAGPTDLLVLHRKDLIAFMAERPEALRGLLLVVGERLRLADDMLRKHSVKNSNEVIEEKLTPLQRMAYWVADWFGSVSFLILHLVLFIVWMIWNSAPVGLVQFDPFPYSALCMVVSLEAIFLSIVVLITQNLEGAREKIRSGIEYDVNLKAELEINHLHSKVDLMHAEVLSRLHRMETKLP